MAKKQNEATPNVNATGNRDVVQRLNFLYQASVYLQSIAPPEEIRTSLQKNKAEEGSPDREEVMLSRKQRKTQRRIVEKKKTTGDLGRSYVQCMRAVGQKSTVKMDPSLKRSLCSNCSTALITGSTASVRVKPSPTHGHVMVYTCLHCKATKRIPAPPNTRAETPVDIPPLATDPMGTETPVLATTETTAQESIKARDARRRRKHDKMVRQLPLFARRDAGHVVFRGNEQIGTDGERGPGVAFV